MLFHVDIKADRLPRGTVCLTYDDGPGATDGDGPGPRTADLAGFLHSRGIPAAFFVIGRHAERHPDLLEQLARQGHLIGNHTYSHPGLANLAASGGDVVAEVARTEAIIAHHVGPGVRFLRPPYGNWREQEDGDGAPRDRPTSIVARALNRDGRLRDTIGPINWDISGEDYDFWRVGRPAEDCARRYLDEVRRAGRGMILMHDSSEDAAIRAGNRAFEMTRLIVPILEAEGYRFIRPDAIPQVRSAMAVTSVIALRTGDGRYLGVGDDPGGRIVIASRSVGQTEQFGVVPLSPGRIVLRAANGLFLAARSEGEGEIVAGAPDRDDAMAFNRPESRGDRIVLGADGHALSDKEGVARWRPAPTRQGPACTFTAEDLFD